jgi:hypothetical protein
MLRSKYRLAARRVDCDGGFHHHADRTVHADCGVELLRGQHEQRNAWGPAAALAVISVLNGVLVEAVSYPYTYIFLQAAEVAVAVDS